MSETNGKTKQWQKCLYKSNGFPDNFTPEESFLAAIEKNKNIHLYSLQECLNGAAVVGQSVSVVFIFCSLYQFLKQDVLTPTQILLHLSLTVILGYCYTVAVTSANWSTVMSWLRAAVVFVTMGYAVSPVLYRLTDSISTDTIHSMAGCGFCLHLLSHDYGITAPVVSPSLSLNAAVFSAVCLASRFSTHDSAFSLLCLAAASFLLLPVSRPVHPPSPSSSVVVALAAVSLVYWLSHTLGLLAALFLVAVQLGCPLIFYRLQDYKATIHGPWDEAVPH